MHTLGSDMKRNLGSIFSIAMAALFLSLVSASDAQAQSGWGFYSGPSNFVSPSYSYSSQGTLQQINSVNYGQTAISTGLPTSYGQRNLSISAAPPASSYSYAQSPSVSFQSARSVKPIS